MENKAKKVSVLDMAMGAIKECVDYNITDIINNIRDVNTNPTKKRVLTLTLEFTPDSTRQNIGVACVAKPKLQTTNPITTSLYVDSKFGETTVYELTPQVPGQLNIDGGEQEQPKILNFIQK